MQRLTLRRAGMIATAMLLPACVNAPPAETHQPLETPQPVATTVIARPTTDLALELREPAVALLPPASRSELTRAPFPMLVLGAEYASRSEVLCDEHWCAISAHLDGYDLMVHATNVWHDAASDEDLAQAQAGAVAIRDHSGLETINEDIRALSWNEHDVAYSLEVECADFRDSHCTDGAFLHGVANGLVFAHQAPAQGTEAP